MEQLGTPLALVDPSLPKRFEATICLTLDGPEGHYEVIRHRRAIACTWAAAKEAIARLPWEDLVGEADLIEVGEVEMVDWQAESPGGSCRVIITQTASDDAERQQRPQLAGAFGV